MNFCQSCGHLNMKGPPVRLTCSVCGRPLYSANPSGRPHPLAEGLPTASGMASGSGCYRTVPAVRGIDQ